ncbi:MAG: FliO/MopB family protein [Methylovulum sp.]|jgi:flagellar protein FliO/FliZ
MTAPLFAFNSIILLFFYSTYCVGATEPASSIVNPHFYSSGGIALVLVVMLFLISAWGFNKLTSRPPSQTTNKMHIVDGISLGMREKIMLLQLGKKQLVIGVTPGKIETLYVLEGEECLRRDNDSSKLNLSPFAQKLKQSMMQRADT